MSSKTRASESEAKIRPITRIPAWSESDLRGLEMGHLGCGRVHQHVGSIPEYQRKAHFTSAIISAKRDAR